MATEGYETMEETPEINLLKDFFRVNPSKGYTVNQILLYIQGTFPEITPMQLHRCLEILYYRHVLERKKSGHHFRYKLKK